MKETIKGLVEQVTVYQFNTSKIEVGKAYLIRYLADMSIFDDNVKYGHEETIFVFDVSETSIKCVRMSRHEKSMQCFELTPKMAFVLMPLTPISSPSPDHCE